MGFFLFTDCFCLHSVILTLEKTTLSHVTVCCILDTMRHNSSHKVTQNQRLTQQYFLFYFLYSFMYSFTLSFFLSILLDILQYRLFKILSSLFFASSDNSLYRYHFIFGGSFVVILIILFRPASVSFPVFCTAMLVSAQSFWCIIFHHCNNPFFSCNPILNSVNVYSY